VRSHPDGLGQVALVRLETSPCLRRALAHSLSSYLVPLLHMLTEECKRGQHGRAIVLMPLKALANDQLRATRKLLAVAGACADAAEASDPPLFEPDVIRRLRKMSQLHVGTYDGDTPLPERGELRARLSIVFTNIDMRARPPRRAERAAHARRLKPASQFMPPFCPTMGVGQSLFGVIFGRWS